MWKIIIADDEPYIREGLKTAVEALDLKLKVIALAKNGAEALALIKAHEADIVLLDICMPRLSGLELLKQIAQLPGRKNLRTIILSGYNAFSYAQEALTLGVSAYLLKPIDEEELAGALRKAIDEIIEKRRQNDYIACLERQLGWKQEESAGCSELVKAALAIIGHRYAEPDFDLLTVAEQLGSNADYLSRRMKQETGFSFKDALSRQRIGKAAELLRSGRYNVAEIAWQVGYTNAQYFSTAFRNSVAMTPREYQKNCLSANPPENH